MIVATILATAFIGASRMSERAVDAIGAAVDAYSPEHIERFLAETEREGMNGHGFPRLAANLGMLVARGRRQEDRELLKRMMTVACRESAKGKMPAGCSGGNEFSVRELVLAIVALEKAGTYPKEVTDGWRADISRVKAEKCYTRGTIPTGANRAYNWCLFGAASEQTRIRHGMGGDAKFVEKYAVDQLRWFDENGMYRDPHEPIVYDLVSRQLYGLILDDGYAGAEREKMEEMLEKSAELTLRMLSACGEIPYGGRSNQFLHNHTLYAAVCAWYAKWYAKKGDWKRSAEAVEAATRAMESLEGWLKLEPVRHVKNRYPWAKPEFGCEKYAYFDKYMVTMGSWCLSVLQFAGDEEEAPRVVEMSKEFHQVLMSAGEYSAQVDYDANAHYDCNGLGRFQRKGAPSAICMAVPCPKGGDLGYRVEATNEVGLALGPVGEGDSRVAARAPDMELDNGKRCSTGRSGPVATRRSGPVATVEGGAAITRWRVGGGIWSVKLSRAGLEMKLEGEGDLALALPAFEFDGAEKTAIDCDGKRLTIAYHGYRCIYEAVRGEIADSGKVCCNRNGRYRRFLAGGKDLVEVKVIIEKENAR